MKSFFRFNQMMKNVEIIFVNKLLLISVFTEANFPSKIYQNSRLFYIPCCYLKDWHRNILKSLADAPSQNTRRNVCRMQMTGRGKEIETFLLLARVSL